MSKFGEAMSAWLASITRDQNLTELGDLILTPMDSKRRWFRSAQLQPTIATGYYDASTGKYVLGSPVVSVSLTASDAPSQLDAEAIATETVWDTTSQATYTLTCPASTAYRVILAAHMNSTRGPRGSLVYTPSGGTATHLIDAGSGAQTQSELNYCISSTSQGSSFIPIRGFWMQAGDTLAITDELFTASDNVRKMFLYETYSV